MTATPRIYGDDAKTKAKEVAAELASMDDPALFGEELHRLGFGEAVGKSTAFRLQGARPGRRREIRQQDLPEADRRQEQRTESGGRRRKSPAAGTGWRSDSRPRRPMSICRAMSQPMRRAVAFSRSIKDSKKFVEQFGQLVAAYKEIASRLPSLLDIEADHVDGTFDALRRGALLDWLKAESPEQHLPHPLQCPLPLRRRGRARARRRAVSQPA